MNLRLGLQGKTDGYACGGVVWCGVVGARDLQGKQLKGANRPFPRDVQILPPRTSTPLPEVTMAVACMILRICNE
jgi:hypothetical protein